MTKILTVPYEAALPSFGSPATRKHVRPRDFVLQGNNGVWVTIASDQYELDKKNGMVRQRSEDGAGNEVDWESYSSYRWSGTIVTSGSRATVTNEALTFADADYADIESGPDEQIQESLASDSVEQDDNSSDESQSDNYVAGVSGYFIDRVTGNAEFNNITARGTIIASAGSIGGWTITATALYKDTGVDATSAGMSPSDYPFYAGATYANRANAPFRVTQAGAVTASNIDLAGGSVSGTFTVSGTLQSSAGNPRFTLTATGLRGYDSGGTQRYQILNDGSGWLGSSSVFSWTAAGVVSLNGSAVVGNSLDAGKVSFYAPTISGLTFTNNSPSAGYVAWSSFTLTYQGVSYTVTSGNSNLKYIYWKKSVSTTVLQASATIPANAADQFMVCVNFSGTAYPSNFAPFIYADYISVANLAAINADMGNITAGTITGGTIRTASSGARTEMNASNLFGLGFGGIGGTDGTTTQWYAKASDGKIYAGGGNIIVDTSGILSKGSTHVKFQKGATTNPVGYLSFKDNVYTNMFMLEWIQTGGGAVTNSIWIKSDTIGLNLAAGDVLLATASAVTIQTALKFNVDNSWDIGASGANRPRDVFIGGEYRFYSERAIVHGIYDRANSDTTVGNTTVETTLYSKSITANDLGTTGGIRVSVFGQWTNNTGANRTLTVRIKFGATTLVSPSMTLTTSGTNGHFAIAVTLFNTATNAQRAMTQVEFRRGATIIDAGWNSSPTSAEDTTSAKTFTVTVQWDAANANATLTKKIAFIELMPA